MDIIWKDILEYEGLYQVSSNGDVRSLDAMVGHNIKGKKKLRKGKMLSPFHTNKGYARVSLCKNGKVRSLFIHRIMAQTFLGLSNDNPRYDVVDHIDNNPSNNCLSNIRVVTQRENVVKHLDPLRGGKRSNGKFQVSINHAGQRVFLGTFDTKDDANRAYQNALTNNLIM